MMATSTAALEDIERQADELLADDARIANQKANRFSWVLQGFIRKWRFIFLVQAGIFAMFRWGPGVGLDQPDHIYLNLFMSDWALWIESLVGIGVFGQAVRDAKVIRFLVLMLKVIVHVARRIEAMEEAHGTLLAELKTMEADEVEHGRLLKTILEQRQG